MTSDRVKDRSKRWSWFTQAYQAEVLEVAGEPSAAACVLLKQVHVVSADAEATEEVCSEELGLFLLDGFLPCGGTT
ncbi:hypothetical protein CIP107518_02198 [Corynebacterium diphtheriae]|nr:hypothetical protein CIP107518_02198 [Corynebacterium diphtheriae]